MFPYAFSPFALNGKVLQKVTEDRVAINLITRYYYWFIYLWHKKLLYMFSNLTNKSQTNKKRKTKL